jgi:hypothetical protein
VRVSWSGAVSDYFRTTNVVKQGNVLFPALFCVYIDDMLLHGLITSCCIGYYIESVFVGALAHANDIVLIASSPSAQKFMLHEPIPEPRSVFHWQQPN